MPTILSIFAIVNIFANKGRLKAIENGEYEILTDIIEDRTKNRYSYFFKLENGELIHCSKSLWFESKSGSLISYIKIKNFKMAL